MTYNFERREYYIMAANYKMSACIPEEQLNVICCELVIYIYQSWPYSTEHADGVTHGHAYPRLP
jgi:hypothetical protein